MKQEICNTERFIELYKDKKYALAFAMGVKHPTLQNTPQHIKMEQNYQTLFANAQKLILLNLQAQAKEQIKKYITVISKRDELQLITSEHINFRKFLLAYEENNFKLCYELMDKYPKIKLVKIAKLLEEHWSKLIKKCEVSANNGDILSIKKILSTLLLTSTRLDTIGSLLRLSFQVKINKQLKNKEFLSCEALLYSYIDIFSEDAIIKIYMKRFEEKSNIILALTHSQEVKDKNDWVYSEITMNLDS